MVVSVEAEMGARMGMVFGRGADAGEGCKALAGRKVRGGSRLTGKYLCVGECVGGRDGGGKEEW